MGVSTLGAVGQPMPAEAVDDIVEHVVVVGVAGLRWDDVDPRWMPTLGELAMDGSVGVMSVRSAPGVTCPAEGWVTLGAGTYAAVVDPGAIDPADGCGARAVLPPTELPRVDRLNRDLRFGARVGWLAEQVGCVGAIGDGAALAAATADGRLAHHSATLPNDTDERRRVLGACPATLVDLGSVPSGADRVAALTRLDGELRQVGEALPADTVLMVLGVAESDGHQPRLHTAVVTGPGFGGGYLRSTSTRRLPYVQLVDVAPSIVQALGGTAPDTIAGRPFVGGAGEERRPGTLAATVAELRDADRRAVAQRRVLPKVWGALGAAFALVLAAFALVLRRRCTAATGAIDVREELARDQLPVPGRPGHDVRRRAAGRRRSPSGAPGLRRSTPGALRLAALGLTGVPAATFLANLVPWWRSGRPALALTLAVVAATALILVVAVAVGRGRTRVQLTVVAVASVAVFFVDAASGAGLQIDSLLGYNALHAGRFVGFGNIAFSVLGAAAVLAAALMADGRNRGAALVSVAAIAVPVVALDGAPGWGADFGGVLTLVPTFVVLALLVSGTRVTWRRLLAAQVAGAVIVGGVGWLDYLRPAADRSHFGRFVGSVLDGTAFATIERKALASWELLFIGPHTFAALLLAVGLVAAVFRPPPLLREAYATHSVLRPLLQATVALALFGFATNDSGVAIPAVVALVMVPAALVLCASPGEPPGLVRTSDTP